MNQPNQPLHGKQCFFDKIATSRQERVVENKHLARTLEPIRKGPHLSKSLVNILEN